MNEGPAELDSARLQRRFAELHEAGLLGGADPLGELAKLAFACLSIGDASRRAVAFGLGAFLQFHSEDRMDRPVQSDENAQFLAQSHQAISNAVSFMNTNGAATDAVKIIAALGAILPRQTP